ncbi:MAG: UDP-N-acetylmuramoyl-L-alanine--D-glutamate ligase [Bacteroidota bacterium]|nr:UDP-N-acetylmuramoyl-L-alanine--D-glutamate ligase [Bacteroidota bacterium]
MSKNIIVLGAGESGAGSAVLASRKGFDVFVSDKGIISEQYKKVLLHDEIAFEEGKHSEKLILQADEVIKSPGIPEDVSIIRKIKEKQIPIISEIEFASRYTDAKMICITGSNGKTTTASLTHHILRNAGLNVGLAGNIGSSFAMQVAEKDQDIYVLEISSFQLDGMLEFKADIAILLNITPDHLDRYQDDFQLYADAKFRITQNQGKDDYFIYCQDDPVITKGLKKRNLTAKLYPFSIKQIITGDGAYITDKEIIVNHNSIQILMTLEMLALQGKHNIYNSMAATITASILDISKEMIRTSLSDFQNIEHRLENVANIHGVEFINDSKATNVNSTWYALESMHRPVIWIAGGVDKGNDYAMLKSLVVQKVKVIICLGTDTKKIQKTFSGLVEQVVTTESMAEAVKYGQIMGKKGDIVLLSPACASFDLFENYIDRGNQFKEIVKAL